MASLAVRAVWIACRVLTAALLVPVTEELAFRGFLLRRFISTDFESVSFRSVTIFAVCASSVLFGVLHRERWLAGSIAGALYAYTARREGRLGEAVAAHALTNALLAAYVLVFQNWSLW